jgi:sulfopyruvate decarboxylase TPP-binding subunit
MRFEEQDAIVAALRCCAVQWLIVVPASGLDRVYRRFATEHECLFVTREEEGVALAAGLAAAGEAPAVIMQQSGVGNCLNAVFTLADAYDLYFPILVATRPENDENPVQRISVRLTENLMGVLCPTRLDWSATRATEHFVEAWQTQKRWIIFPA